MILLVATAFADDPVDPSPAAPAPEAPPAAPPPAPPPVDAPPADVPPTPPSDAAAPDEPGDVTGDQSDVGEEPDGEIVVEARRDSPRVTEQVLDRERVLQTPGTFEDPVRLVQALPGVAVTPEYSPTAGDLAVRGASPRESRYVLDGVELPYLYHFNGYSSVFHARLLDELMMQPSTFGTPWGDAIGAVVETRSVTRRPEAAHGSLNVNPIMVGVAAETPIGDEWAARGSARRSYLDLFSGDEEQYTVFPSFWDYFGRVEHTPENGGRYSLFAFGAGDHYERYAGEPTLLDPYEKSVNPTFAYTTSFHAAGLTHAYIFGTTRFSGTLAWTGAFVDATLPDASDHEVEHRIQLREDIVTTTSPVFSLAAGINPTVSYARYTVATDRAWSEVERESPLLGRGVGGDADIWRMRGGLYGEGRITLGPVRLVPGVRVDGDTLTESIVADPRFNARISLGKDTRVRVAGGLYHQFPDTDLLLAPFGDPTLGPMESWQVAGGLETAIAGRLEATVEGYHTWGSNLVETNPGEAPVGGIEGRAYGVEVGLRYRMRNVFFSSITGSYSHSERDGHLADYDQPWTLNAVASWTFLPTWNAGLRVRYASGLPYTPVLDGLYEATDDTYTPIEGEPNSARLPDYMKIDAHFEKRFSVWKGSVTLYAEVWYVPDFANTMYLSWRYDYDDVAAVHGPGFVPLVGLRAEL